MKLKLKQYISVIKKLPNIYINFIKYNIGHKNQNRSIGFVFILGLVNALASPPFSLIIVPMITFSTAAYIIVTLHDNIKSILFLLIRFTFGYYFGMMSWMLYPIVHENIIWLFFYPLAIVLLVLPHLPLYALTATIITIANKTQRIIITPILMIISLFIGDYIRSYYYFNDGFPWMRFGHLMHFDSSMQILRSLNFNIFSILVIALFFALYYCYYGIKDKIKPLYYIGLSTILLWLTITVIGGIVLNTSPDEKPYYTIIAPQMNNKAQKIVSQETAAKTILDTANAVSWAQFAHSKTLIIFPESTILFNLRESYNLRTALSTIVPNQQSLLLSGGTMVQNNKLYNVIYALSNFGILTDIYSKEILVPFGEYLPFKRFLPKKLELIASVTEFNTFPRNDNIIHHVDLPNIIPAVCYEIIFYDMLKNRVKKLEHLLEDNNNISNHDRVIVNVTNDGWFGWTPEPYQHLIMSKFAAIVTKTNIIRVSNNGISAYINKYGKIIIRTKLNQPDVLFFQQVAPAN